MTRAKKWTFRILGGLTILAGGAWFAATSVIRWKINQKPGVHVEKVEILSTKCHKLHNITFDRTWAKGSVQTVTVCSDNTVIADGGNVDVDLDLRKKESSSSSSYRIEARNFKAHVKKGEVTADLESIDLLEGSACASKALILHPKGSLTVETLCGKLDGTDISFASGKAQPTIEVLGHKLGEVTLGKTSIDPVKRFVRVETVSYDRIAARGVQVSFDGKINFKADAITIQDARLHSGPLTALNVQVDPFDPAKVGEDPLGVTVNGAKVNLDVKARHAWGDNPCQTWLDAVPNELKEGVIKDVRFVGNFKFDLQLKPDVKLDWKLDCKAPKPMPAFVAALTKQFEYTVYDPDGKPVKRISGPSSPEWAYIQSVSPNVVMALTTTEDPGFFHHNGFIREAIENSLRDNLKAGKVIRGGSTLTMQLAKNLWLNRSRTASRKVQEAILTIVLESYLSKEQLLELYVNVVEFGPNIYGISNAAKKLVGTEAMKLSLVEATYLVLRLPRPTKSGPLDDAKKAQIKKLMAMMVASGKVTEDMVAAEESVLDDPGAL